MAAVRRDEGFIENQRGILEAGVEIAVNPLILRLAHGQAAFLGLGEVRRRPFELSHLGRWRSRRSFPRFRRRCRRPDPDVALGARIRPTRAKRIKWIDSKRQMFELDLNFLDRLGGCQFVYRRHGQNRLALVERFHGERFFALLVGSDHRPQVGHAVGRGGKIILGEDGSHTGHRQCFAEIEALHPPMRHGTEQQPREQHAFRAEILGVFRPAGHLRVKIRGCVVFADNLVLGSELLLIRLPFWARHGSPSSGFLLRASWR